MHYEMNIKRTLGFKVPIDLTYVAQGVLPFKAHRPILNKLQRFVPNVDIARVRLQSKCDEIIYELFRCDFD